MQVASASTRSVSLEDVRQARARISSATRVTPVLPVPGRQGVHAKLESLQITGSFKLRGAFNMLAGLTDAQRSQGVVTHSSGNHAQGVACAAYLLGCHATIVIPEGAPQIKVDRTASWGARIIRCGPSSSEREEVAAREAESGGLTMVPPFDHPAIIAGQGTVALELLEQLPNIGTVFVPVGGGGLAAGVALAVKSLRPDVRVIAVEPELAADAAESHRTGERVTWPAGLANRTIADGVRTQQVGEYNLPFLLEFIDDFVLVPEDAIRAAVRHYVHEMKATVEPTGALTLAALDGIDASSLPSGDIAVIVSGGNIEPRILAELAGQ